MRHDTLADALSVIKNGEKVGKKDVIVPASGVVREVLRVVQAAGYIGNFEFVEDGKAGQYKVTLKGNISDGGAIKPRYSVDLDCFEKWEKRYLPSKDLGLLIVSTSKGVMPHGEAKTQHVGGILLAYIY